MTKTLLRWALAPVLGTLAVLAMLGVVAVVIGGPLWVLYQLLGWTLLTWGSIAALGVAAIGMILSWGHDLARRLVR